VPEGDPKSQDQPTGDDDGQDDQGDGREVAPDGEGQLSHGHAIQWEADQDSGASKVVLAEHHGADQGQSGSSNDRQDLPHEDRRLVFGLMASPIGGPPAPDAGGEKSRGTPVLLPEGWVATVTDKIVSTVDKVRSKTTTPVEKVGRAVVWGLLIATAGTALLIVLLAGVLRLLFEAVGRIPGISDRAGRSVWVVDLLIGVLLILVGLRLIRRGETPQRQD